MNTLHKALAFGFMTFNIIFKKVQFILPSLKQQEDLIQMVLAKETNNNNKHNS